MIVDGDRLESADGRLLELARAGRLRDNAEYMAEFHLPVFSAGSP